MNYAVILAGGQGSRFWPLSRECLPKQFLKIVEEESLLGLAVRRIQNIIPPKNIFIISNRVYLKELKRHLKKFKIPDKNIILEPKPLNTLPAVGLCARLINIKDADANLLVLPSDHYIKDNTSFLKVIHKAFDLSSSGFLCLIGIKPDRPFMGYGYIEIDKRIEDDAFSVRYFREKPDSLEAKSLFRKKRVFWNSGIFCFKARTILNEVKSYQPALYHNLIKIKTKSDIKRVWTRIKPISIDYGIMQKSKRLSVVVGRFYWCDLGSWEALCDVMPKDKNNNVVLSERINLDSSNILVYSYSPKRLIATVGLKDLIIVDTHDALLVCRKDKTQDIKRLVEILKRKRKKYV